MRGVVLPVLLGVLVGVATAEAGWVSYYKNRSDGTVYFYNSDKLKSVGAIRTVWMRVGDGYPGKITMDCKSATYASITGEVVEIAPDTMMDSLAKVICQDKAEPAKVPPPK